MDGSNILAIVDARCIVARRDDGTEVHLCDIEQGDDGFWYASSIVIDGYTDAWVLRSIADRIDELNKPWRDHINLYFTWNGQATKS